MKKTAFLFASACAMAAHAAPIYYTFTGKVQLVAQDQGGYAAAHNIKTGSDVTYIFEVDTTQQGFTQTSGAKTEKTDVDNPGASQNYYYDSLINPSLFSPAVTNPADGSYFGYRSIIVAGTGNLYSVNFQVIIGDNASLTQVAIHIPDTSASNWLPVVNGSYAGTESYTAGSANSSMVSLFLTCTAVSATRPSGIVRPSAGAGNGWLHAGMRAGALAVENHSGDVAQASILDGMGRTAYRFPLAGAVRIPDAELPRGVFLLQVRAAGRNAVTLPFVR